MAKELEYPYKYTDTHERDNSRYVPRGYVSDYVKRNPDEEAQVLSYLRRMYPNHPQNMRAQYEYADKQSGYASEKNNRDAFNKRQDLMSVFAKNRIGTARKYLEQIHPGLADDMYDQLARHYYDTFSDDANDSQALNKNVISAIDRKY